MDTERMNVLRVLGGEPIWPPPIWLMRQAGRFLPEYREIRAKAGDFLSLCRAPAMAAEVTLQPVRRFGLDAAILFSDILVLPWAMGRDLRFAQGEGPLMSPLDRSEAMGTIDPGKIAPVMETIGRVRAELDPTIALIGFAGSPFTVACYVIDGQGGGSFPRICALAHEAPGFVRGVVDALTQATITYLAGQVRAGVNCVMLFDSWSGLLAPAQFRDLVIRPNAAIVAALKRDFPALRIIGFPRLAGLMLGEYAKSTGVDAVGLDTHADPLAARAMVPASIALQGNLDPLALRAGGQAMRDAAAGIARTLADTPHIFNLGHGILPDTDPAHVADLLAHIRGLDKPDQKPSFAA